MTITNSSRYCARNGWSLILAAAGCLPLSGCHSAFVDATITNSTPTAVKLVEVDYPSASFGKEELGPGQVFKYHFKILGQGATKITWTDSQQHDRAASGPELREGQMGTLAISIQANGATWQPNLHR